MKKMLADQAAPVTSASSTDLFFGDFEADCAFCGKECSGTYCSDLCEMQSKQSPQLEDEMLPALTSGYSHSSTSSQCSTPEVSPMTKPDRSHESDIAVFDLGEPVEQLLSRSLRNNLNFDYSYKLDGEGQPHANAKASPRSLDLRFQPPLDHAAFIQGPLSLGKTPTNDTLRLRRTPLQNPTQPRKATTNLLSPVLQPALSPQIRPKVKAHQSAPFKLAQPPARESKRVGGCGKPGCASVAGHSGGIGMVRRASAPLSAQRAASTSSSVITATIPQEDDSAVASSSSSSDNEQTSTSQRHHSSVSRGRSRHPGMYAAAEVRGRSHHRETSHRLERRADSAHAPSDHRGAPICLQKDECLTARPLCGELKKTRSASRHGRQQQVQAFQHPGLDLTRSIATRSSDGSQTRHQFYGRAAPSAAVERRASYMTTASDSSNDDLDAVDFKLGSPAGQPSLLPSESADRGDDADDDDDDDASPPLASPPKRGRRNTAAHIIREAAAASDDSSSRGRSKARGSSAAAYRSRSPNRAFSRLRRLS